jgi:phospholipase/lecithinase/hemolysin
MNGRIHSSTEDIIMNLFSLARWKRTTLSLLAVCAVLVATGPALPAKDVRAVKADFKSITVIGDSLSDTGRLFRVTGMPSAPYYQGRVSNGPLWVEYFAPRAGMTYDASNNFSWAGATTGRGNAFGPPLPGMLDELDEVLGTWNPGHDKHALHVVFGGANDFFRILVNGESHLVVIPEAVANLVSIVTQLRARGARYIVVVDLPDIGLTPRARAGGPAAAAGATQLSILFNTLLKNALAAADPGVVHVSAFQLLNHMAANPGVYGFTDVTNPGIMNLPAADTHLFWDDIHPTTRAHRFVADAVFDAVRAAGLLKHPADKL